MTLFTAPQNLPFGVALVVMLGLAVLEVLGLLLSFSVSDWIDHSVLPEHPETDAGIEGILGWLHVGKVPTLVLLVLFLTGFALIGYLIQIAARGVINAFLPALLAAPLAAVGAVISVRTLGGWLAHVIPRDETSTVSDTEFIGRVATITAATANRELATQARLKDVHGRSHYILVEPDGEPFELADGMEVLIVKKVGAIYRVIENPHPTLM